MGLPTSSFAGVVGEAITVLSEEPEADADGSNEVLVFGFLGTEGGRCAGDAFLGNNEKNLNTIKSMITSKTGR